jgi:hypothetical protein
MTAYHHSIYCDLIHYEDATNQNLVEYFNKWIIWTYIGDVMPDRSTFNLENCRTKPRYIWYWAIYTKNVDLVWTLVHVTLIMYIRLSRSGPRARIEIWPVQQNDDTLYTIYTWLWLTTFIRNTSVTPVEISTRNRNICCPLKKSMKSISYASNMSAALLQFYLIF